MSSLCFYIPEFCDPCWYMWHAKGTLQQHRKVSVLSAVRRPLAPQTHEDVPTIRKVRWRPPLDRNKSVIKEVSVYERLTICCFYMARRHNFTGMVEFTVDQAHIWPYSSVVEHLHRNCKVMGSNWNSFSCYITATITFYLSAYTIWWKETNGIWSALAHPLTQHGDDAHTQVYYLESIENY